MKIRNMLYAGLIAVFALSGCSAAGGPTPASSRANSAQNAKGQSETTSSQAETAASAAAPENAYHKITADEAKKMIDNGGVTIVDVRRADEYADKHIPGAVNVPNEEIGSEQPETLPDPDAVLLVYCRSGVRSKAASDKLVKMGYANVYDFGGIIDWPYETISGSSLQPTEAGAAN